MAAAVGALLVVIIAAAVFFGSRGSDPDPAPPESTVGTVFESTTATTDCETGAEGCGAQSSVPDSSTTTATTECDPGTEECGGGNGDGIQVVRANCEPAPAECAGVVAEIVRAADRPTRIELPAGDYIFGSTIDWADDVELVGVGQPRIVADASPLFNLDGTNRTLFSGIDIDMGFCTRSNGVFLVNEGADFSEWAITDVNIVNGNSYDTEPGQCRVLASSGTGTDLVVDNVTADRMQRFLWFRTGSDHRSVSVTNTTVTDIEHSIVLFDGYAEDVTITGNTFSGNSPNAVSGHYIGFQPAKTGTPEPTARNVVITDNLIEGNPDTPHVKIDGRTQATGGSADLVAIRGIDGFVLENNIIRHSGEVGITATAGLRNGVIANNVVSFTDTAGVVIGNNAADNAPVENIEVYGNDLSHNGLDRAVELRPRGWTMPTMSVWNAVNVCITHNLFHDNTIALGLWVFNGDSERWPASVFDLWVDPSNVFVNNARDFVQSDHPNGGQAANGYEDADPSGGDTWTAAASGCDVNAVLPSPPSTPAPPTTTTTTAP